MTATVFRSAAFRSAAAVCLVAGVISACATEEQKQATAAATEFVAAYTGDWTVPGSCFGTDGDVTIHLGPTDNTDLYEALTDAYDNRVPDKSYLEWVTPIGISADGLDFHTTGTILKSAGEVSPDKEATTYDGAAVMGVKPADPGDPDNTQVVQIPFIATNPATGENGFVNFIGFKSQGNLLASCQMRPQCDAEVMSQVYVTLMGAKTRGDIERLAESSGHLPDLIRCGTEQPTELVRQSG
ncbi:hypothetical protein ACFSSC_09275 [Corynebacterium mendelii]|uniref:Uncharacterized protein n=1 Tax=Corynebacterium mendelii TaxID=2765362 RepID=A0A939E3N2_9CORY|nr:hypothetical protein [Corynebacterium mendelii]MBN9645168.1 hypothetical protein [Corynebacterium mendelii]